MNEELLQKAMQMFEGKTPEKWNAFLELVNRNGEIQNRWWQRLQTEVYQREAHAGHPDWEIRKWGNWDLKWFIKGDNENSLMIHFWGDCLRVFSNAGYLDATKVSDLIKDKRFDIIKTCLDRIDGSDWATIGWEHRNFSFDCIYDGKFPNHQTLSWYAGNRTDEFADQLITKIRKFQTPEITALFKEINEKCRKDTP